MAFRRIHPKLVSLYWSGYTEGAVGMVQGSEHHWLPFEGKVATALKETGKYTHNTALPAEPPELSSAFMLWLFTTHEITHPVVHIENVIFPEACDLRAHSADRHFEFYNCRFLGDLDLRHLRVRQLILDGSDFSGCVRMNGAKIEQGVLANGAHFHELVLQAADLGGNLELTGSRLDLPIKAYQLRVAKSVFIREGTVLPGANLINAQIGSHCQFRGAVISGDLDLTGAVINGELQFGQSGKEPIHWLPGATLSLRNVRARSFGARLSDFRCDGKYVPVDLAGFSFEDFAAASLKDNISLAHESPKELLKWIRTSEEASSAFDPKPYFELAHALEKAGQTESARRIRIGLGWRQTLKAKLSPLTRIGRIISGAFIDFGHAPWKALTIFLVLFMFGMGHAYVASFGWDIHSLNSSIAIDTARISLENSIPLIEFSNLPDRNLCEKAGGVICREVSNFDHLMFDVQKILSLLLASYFVAAITGYATIRRTD